MPLLTDHGPFRVFSYCSKVFVFVLDPFRDEAEMDYLKIAQDLEMYGISYFSITVSLGYSNTNTSAVSSFIDSLTFSFWMLPLFSNTCGTVASN